MSKTFVRALFASTCFMTASGLAYAAAAPSVPTAADGIGGVVTGTKGPEAGVWVIAETRDLPTRFIKIVVTDDQGRFMLPELPKANTTSGFAAMASWTPNMSKACRARTSISKR